MRLNPEVMEQFIAQNGSRDSERVLLAVVESFIARLERQVLSTPSSEPERASQGLARVEGARSVLQGLQGLIQESRKPKK